MNSATDMTVATIIRQQIGEGALYMLGAKAPSSFIVGGENFLKFCVKGTTVCNRVKITLNGKDLYDVEFSKYRNLEEKVVKVVNDLYFDQLKSVIERTTKLYMSL